MPKWADRVARVGSKYAHWSTLSTGEDNFRRVLNRAALDAGGRFENVLEIGTHYGVSASCIADYADSIVTVDCSFYPEAEELWTALNCADRISVFWETSEASKAKLAGLIKWDMVYIDGDHREAGCWADFLAVKDSADSILLHDYGDARPGIEGPTRVVERSGLDWTIDGAFAYWRRSYDT